MNKNIIIVGSGALLIAFLVAFAVQLSLGGKKQAPVHIQKEARVEVLVASKDLIMGQQLKDGDLIWQSWPKGTVFAGAVVRQDGQKASEALEGRLRRDIAKGEPALRSALVTESKGNFVAASLEPGMRAVAIKVSAESMVGGFLEPGDYVDVIMTYKKTIRIEGEENIAAQAVLELNLDKFATETILERVRILAVDQKAQRPEEGKIKVGKTVTLAVNMQDAEKLALGSQLGDLTLSLRGIGDEGLVEKKWPTISDARLTNIGNEVLEELKKVEGNQGFSSSNKLKIFNGSAVKAIKVR